MRIMRLKEVAEKAGLAKSTIYNLISLGSFPTQVELGARSVGWVDIEVEGWMLVKMERRELDEK